MTYCSQVTLQLHLHLMFQCFDFLRYAEGYSFSYFQLPKTIFSQITIDMINFKIKLHKHGNKSKKKKNAEIILCD